VSEQGTPLADRRILGTAIEFNVTEHCNLRCAGCDHASPILPRRFADLDRFRADLSALARVFHARELKLLGGEPLLHPQLPAFLAAAREIGIADGVTLVTNGVLLHRADPAIFDAIDKLWISLYPGVVVRQDLRQLRRLARARGFALRVRRMRWFRETLLNTPHRRPETVERVFARCGMAHAWSCHTIHEGYYYKCSPAPFLEARLAAAGIGVRNREQDGVRIHGNPDLRDELQRYLACERPLQACAYCLGSSGRRLPHHQLDRGELQAAMEDEPGDPEDLLEKSPVQRARQILVRIAGLSYS
jgi:organic radical activating enzyme